MTVSDRPVGRVFLLSCTVLAACSDSGSGEGGAAAPDFYVFEREGESTVAYTGQSTRQVLIEDLVGLLKSISSDVIGGRDLDRYDTPDEVYALLTPLYEEGGVADPSRAIPDFVADDDTMLQSTYADLNDANLQSKTAGNDFVTDHAKWNEGDFEGWASANLVVNAPGDLGVPATPEELIRAYFWTFAHQAAAAATGTFPIDASTPLYLTPEGLIALGTLLGLEMAAEG